MSSMKSRPSIILKRKRKTKKSDSVPSLNHPNPPTYKGVPGASSLAYNTNRGDVQKNSNNNNNNNNNEQSAAVVLPSSESSTSLKWCLYPTSETTEPKEELQTRNTPTDFILKHFLAEFRNLTSIKIQNILQLSIVCKFNFSQNLNFTIINL
jgi:hypothetical protein